MFQKFPYASSTYIFSTQSTLESVAETCKTLNHLATGRSPLVGPHELEVQHERDDNNQSTRNHSRHDSRAISGLILRSENSATNNTTNTSSADQGCGAQCSLPLATDVVSLPCQDTRDVGIAGGGGEKYTCVAHADVLGESKHGETGETEHAVEDDEGRADVPFVSVVGEGVHDDGGADVWWGDEALGLVDGEPCNESIVVSFMQP